MERYLTIPLDSPLVTTVLGGREIFLLLLDGPRVPDLGALLVTPDVPALASQHMTMEATLIPMRTRLPLW